MEISISKGWFSTSMLNFQGYRWCLVFHETWERFEAGNFHFCSDGWNFEINHHHPFSLEDGLICEQQKLRKCSLPQDPDPQFHSLVLWGKKKTLSQFIWLAFLYDSTSWKASISILPGHQAHILKHPLPQVERDVGHPLQEKHGMELFYRWLFFWISSIFVYPDFFFDSSNLASVFSFTGGEEPANLHERPTKIQRIYHKHAMIYHTFIMIYQQFIMFCHTLTIDLPRCLSFLWGRIRFLNAHLLKRWLGPLWPSHRHHHHDFLGGWHLGARKPLDFPYLWLIVSSL